MTTIDYIVIALYMLLSVFLGCRLGKKQVSTEQYFLSGRNMKWLPVAIALFAALFSSISYIAMPGEGYNFGLSMLVCGLTGIVALPVMLFVFMKFFYNMKLWTINEYLENRFSVSVRILCGGIFLFARCLYIGVVLYATAMLLARSFGVSPMLAIIAVGVVSTIYTYFGGMDAVIWTDVMQFIVLLGGILLIIGVVAWQLDGGIAGIWDVAAANGKTFNLGIDSGFWDFSMKHRLTVWPLLIGLPFALFMPATDQINLQRCMTCKSFGEVARAVSVSTISNPFVCFIFYFAGLAVFAYYKVVHADKLPTDIPGVKGDEIFCYFVSHELPPGCRGILIAGILAAVMSTISAVENSLATVWVKDVYQRILRPGLEDGKYVQAAKITTLIIGTITCLFGVAVLIIFRGRNIPLLEVSNTVLGMLSNFTCTIFLLGLLTRRANARGIIAGVIAGIPVTFYTYVFCYLLKEGDERMSFMVINWYPMATILIVGYLVSIFTGSAKAGAEKYVIWSRWSKKKSGEK
ncbi:MAG: sodium/solute symporter [Lentisphaeria bacterium]|nr:sodium/solute symporter [Lentisphaeria bacterium]